MTFQLDKPFFIAVEENWTWEDDAAVQVKFNRILGDSRCPADAICVWAGRAEAEIIFEQPGGSVTDTLAFGDFSGSTHTDQAHFGNYTVQLLSVLPIPKTTQTIQPGDYKLQLEVRKAE